MSPERLPVAPEDKMPYANLIADQILRLEERVATLEISEEGTQAWLPKLEERVAKLEQWVKHHWPDYPVEEAHDTPASD